MQHRSYIFLALLLGLVLSPAVQSYAAAEKNRTAEQDRFFETRIRPLLADNCYQCHGPDKQASDLRLDSREGVLRGGASGKSVIVAGQPEKSRLIRAVRHQDEMLKMPPKQRLSDRQIADLTRWVQMGAPYADAKSLAERETGPKFWAFQSPVDPPLPAVKVGAWAKMSLDRLVLAQLEAYGLRPAPPADKRTLIRRATFDLTGLPPTPQEIEAFLDDKSPEALAHVIDRLLASPAYGERWGRHWLDIACYADSNGLDLGDPLVRLGDRLVHRRSNQPGRTVFKLA